MNATVKVMRSYDYCHFEISLSDDCADLDAVNELRKQAAILADEAVRQYKIAKEKEGQRQYKEREMKQLLDKIDFIAKKPKSEWTCEEAALMRSKADKDFFKDYQDSCYFYDDEGREHHFSMLSKFKDVRVKT